MTADAPASIVVHAGSSGSQQECGLLGLSTPGFFKGLPEKWRTQYKESSAEYTAEIGVIPLALISACPGTGKSSLINHLGSKHVSEVHKNGGGSTKEAALKMVSGKQEWSVRDCPAARGGHMLDSKRARLGAGVAGFSEMAGTKVAEIESTVPAESYYRRNFYRWSAKAIEMTTAVGNSYAQSVKKLADKDFVTAYSLDDLERAEALVLVVSAKHSAEQLAEEKKLMACKELHATRVPVLVVVTHSPEKADADGSLRMLKSLGLEKHPCTRVLNVDVAWDGQQDKLLEAVMHNHKNADFPDLMNILDDVSNPASLARAVIINRMVHAKVDEAVRNLEKPAVLDFAWVFASHSTLAILLPIVGPVAETFSRMMLLALCIYEAVGLLRSGSAKAAEKHLEQELEKQKKVKEKKTQNISTEVGKGTGETAAVAVIEVGLKEGAMGLGQTVYEATRDLALEMAAQSAGELIYGALPFVGALITMATMPHSYMHMALGAKKIAYSRHAAWVAGNGNELGLFA